ncbi:MAG: hypothetical protein ACRC0G_08315 [Fusobacteriaceae bacterium]
MNIKTIFYTLKKIKAFIVENQELKKYKLTNNIYSNIDFKKNKKIKKILIFLNNSYYAHLGDQLFFEPLLNMLNKNYDVVISPTKVMQNYFIELGYSVDLEPNFENYDLIITRTDFYSMLKNLDNVLFLKTTDLKKKVCRMFLEEVSLFLNIKDIGLYSDKPQKLLFSEENSFEINKKDKYIIFSNYIDSGSLFTSKKNFQQLEEVCIKRAQEFGYKVIHLGSQKDKENDKKEYGFVDIDLRGKTSILDIFKIISNEKIIEYIGFDGFIMHLFFIYEKQMHVKVRNKLTKKRMDDIVKFVNPPFEMIDYKNKINYIGD